MRTISLASVALFVIAGALAVPKSAWALGPVDLEIAARGGGAFLANEPAGAPNPLGFGLGGRAGVDIFTSYYVGVTGMYYFGATASSNTDDISTHAVQYGVDVGYNIYLFKLIGLPDTIGKLLDLRPQLGIGNLTISESQGLVAPGSPGLSTPSQDVSNLYLEPGLVGLISVGWFLAGADVNALWIPKESGPNAGLTAHIQLGIKL
jgi:hypothetical protein